MSHNCYSLYLPLSASDKAIRNAACDEAQEWSRERECSFSEIVSSYAVLRYKAKPVYTEDEADRLHDEHCYALNVFPVWRGDKNARYEKLVQNFDEKIRSIVEAKEKFLKEHGLGSIKAEFVTCRACGSKLNRKRLIHPEGLGLNRIWDEAASRCPVCGAAGSLHSNTFYERLSSYNKRILDKKVEKEMKAEEYQKKQKANALLVLFDVHD